MKIELIKEHKPISQIFECFKDLPNVAFLDSSLHVRAKSGGTTGNEGRYSIIGLYPYFSLSIQDGKTKVNGTLSNNSFEVILKDYLKDNKEANHTSLPIISGAIGYFSYDYGLRQYGIVSQHKGLLDSPQALLHFYDVFIIEDHEANLLYIVANGKLKAEDDTIQEIKEILDSTLEKAEPLAEIPKQFHGILTNIKRQEVKADFENKDYIEAIEKMKKHIVEGDIYVVNMTEQFRISSCKDPYEVFKLLRTLSPSPFGAYMNYTDFAIISSSPERFLKVKNNKILTSPIKGTRKRGKTKEEDEMLKRELECSEKEKSELLMIVDLERNDLNKICKPGSVKVNNLFSIASYAQVFHLASDVEGQLKEEGNEGQLDAIDILSAMFPGGSITGTPKLSAMKIIDSVEKSSRNLYTGSIGYIGLDGSMDLNIVIRTAIYQNRTYHVGAGGGITYESDAEFEMEEVLQKAKALFHSILT